MNDNGSFQGNVSDIARVEYTPSPKRGFAAMDKEKVRQIASAGGKAAHAKGTAHRFSKEEAKVAGSKGGKAPRRAKVGQ